MKSYITINPDLLPSNARRALSPLTQVHYPLEDLKDHLFLPCPINLGQLMTSALALEVAFDLLLNACRDDDGLYEEIEEKYAEVAKPLIIAAHQLKLTKTIERG